MSSDQKIVIVRTGTANIGSVTAAFERLGYGVSLTEDPVEIMNATRVVVPGVGTFGASMELIKQSRCDSAIKKRVESNLPTLFVCVGLQIMCGSSEESEGATGLDIFKNLRITRFPDTVTVPQHGWNIVTSTNKGFVTDGFAYFSNSFKITLDDFKSSEYSKDWNPAVATHGVQFIAALQRGNVLAWSRINEKMARKR